MMQNGNTQNVTDLDFEKKIFWANLGQNMPKNEVFLGFLEFESLNLSEFLYMSRLPS